jgi:hypothetical protein
MPLPEISQLAKSLIDPLMEPRRESLRRELLRVSAEMTSRGLLRSSITIHRYAETCATEVQERANTVLTQLRRAIAAIKPPPAEDLEQRLKEEAGARIDLETRSIQDILRATASYGS